MNFLVCKSTTGIGSDIPKQDQRKFNARGYPGCLLRPSVSSLEAPSLS